MQPGLQHTKGKHDKRDKMGLFIEASNNHTGHPGSLISAFVIRYLQYIVVHLANSLACLCS